MKKKSRFSVFRRMLSVCLAMLMVFGVSALPQSAFAGLTASAAVATYTVTYDVNGGSGSVSSQTKTHDVDLTLRTTVPTWTGHTFVGWNTNKSASTATYQPGDVYRSNSNLTLYAIWKINTYTVSYDTVGGTSSLSDQTKTYGVDLTLRTTVPTWTGHTFVGWNTNKNAATATYQPGDVYTANNDLKLYAIWTTDTYTVSYDTVGGTSSLSNQTKTHGVDLTLRTTVPTWAGHTFVGWNTNKNATTATYQPGDVYTANSDLKLYAIWTTDTYTVSYDTVGGTSSLSNQTKTYGVDITLRTTVPTWAGHTFVGWNTNKNATTATYQPGDVYTANNDLKLYAIWKTDTYTISYDTIGGTSSLSNQTKTYGVDITLRTTVPTWAGHTFVGWNTNKNATTATYQPGDVYTANSDLKLYAIWKINTFTVTYDTNGGSTTLGDQTKYYGQDLTLRTTVPSRSGYYFVGWNTNKNSSSATYHPGDVYKSESDLKLYAIWTTTTYTVSYNMNGGTGSINSQTKISNVELKLTTTVPKRTGYEFIGWNTNKNATTAQYNPGGSYTYNGNTTLYAVWKGITYTVSYDMNGGSGEIDSQTKLYDQNLTLSAIVPVRTGYTFLGWSTDANAEKADHQPVGTYTDNKDAVLYAVWKPYTYLITYMLNGGSGTVENQTKEYDKDLILSSVVPTRENYRFIGWNTDANAQTAQYQSGGTFTQNSDATLYAIWQKANPELKNETTVTKTNFKVGESIIVTGAASGGSGNYTYEFYYKRSTVNNWTKFDKNGSGTFKPGSAGTFTIRTYVKDSSGKAAVKDFSLTASDAALLSNETTVTALNFNVGDTVTVKGAANGGSGTYTYEFYYKRSTVNNWTRFDKNGIGYFKPGSAGSFIIKTYVKDSWGSAKVKKFTLTAAPKLENKTTVTKTEFSVGESITVKGAAEGGSGTYTYEFYYKRDGVNQWTRFDKNGTGTFKPGSAGTFTIRTYVKDSSGHASVKDFKLAAS